MIPVVLVLLGLWRPFLIETYVMTWKMESPHWVVVELGNSNCPAAEEGWLWREFQIPESGYLCVSNFPEKAFLRFEIALQDGTRKKLEIEESIHGAKGLELSGPCSVSAFTFFYGSGNEIKENDMLDEIRRRHPECDQSWHP